MSALTKISFKLLGFLKILLNYGCFCMVVQCSRTMLDVRVLFFILEEVFSVNTTCFVKTMVNARIVVTPLFQMTFQFPKPFFGSLFIGADAFDSESLAVRNTFGAMFRMTTLWGQVLMFICRFVVYVN